MKNAILTGATGMIGSIVLKACLESSEIGMVTSISRRPSGVTHPKLKEIIHTDFKNYQSIQQEFANQDVAYFCIGVYTGQVPRDKFREITVEYTAAFAELLKQQSPSASFCFLSGQGADPTEKSRVAFAKDKGIAENAIMKLNFPNTFIFRPGYIYPVEARAEPNFSYRLMRFLYPVVNKIAPKMSITSEQLGQAMFSLGLSGAGRLVLENEAIKTA